MQPDIKIHDDPPVYILDTPGEQHHPWGKGGGHRDKAEAAALVALVAVVTYIVAGCFAHQQLPTFLPLLCHLSFSKGVMMPSLENQDHAMTLAMLGTLRDELVGEEHIADYLLYTLNSIGNFKWVVEAREGRLERFWRRARSLQCG